MTHALTFRGPMPCAGMTPTITGDRGGPRVCRQQDAGDVLLPHGPGLPRHGPHAGRSTLRIHVYTCTRVCASPAAPPGPLPRLILMRVRAHEKPRRGICILSVSHTHTQSVALCFVWWLPGGLGIGVARGRGEERRRVVHARGVPRPPAAAAAAGHGQRPARRLSRTKPAGPFSPAALLSHACGGLFSYIVRSSAHHVLDYDRGITTDYIVEYYGMQV